MSPLAAATYTVQRGHRLETGTLLSATTFATLATRIVATQTRMVNEDLAQQFVRATFELILKANRETGQIGIESRDR